MLTTLPAARPAAATTYHQLIDQVQRNGLYSTQAQAEAVTRSVLAALGRQVTGEERVELAQRLPKEVAREFASQVPATEPLSGFGFVQDVAARTGTGAGAARWDVGSVLRAVAQLAGPGLVDRILAQLPNGYALLFGQVRLPRPQAS
ncbi:DUF2267 domain-containing protein [Streptomyces ficellus]|uniref:DUF2267 domain-containing protein n=1 Tax=Streptomyces ficellus TaxID=1977088 RepID=A0ABT7Z6W3_9ACTN|nr:DUF2267 domain-containing protein [Streptomyces ficellus]MDN3295210.1 DUF2267 domain-containing protein [Streptomyces ficellus]